ncbi:MAG: energy transducer TonB [Ginsengibacter sp.]
MEANHILSANLLDIIFDGKNKDYGAYQLRKTYNKRISISLIISIGIIAILLTGFVIANKYSPENLLDINGPDVVIQPPPPVEPPPPLPPPILPPPPPPVATIAFPPPVIVIDELVVKPPPEIQELLDAKIDVKTVEGTKDIGNIAPPIDVIGTQVVAVPVKKKNDDTVFISVEIDAMFRGGAGEWTKYVSKEIQRNNDEFTEADFGTCVVKFIVDKTGKVSHVEATTMKGSKLAEIATNAIRKGPDWIPAQQNGMYVNAYRIQPVTLNNPDK